jgi:hypothetical protein
MIVTIDLDKTKIIINPSANRVTIIALLTGESSTISIDNAIKILKQRAQNRKKQLANSS